MRQRVLVALLVVSLLAGWLVTGGTVERARAADTPQRYIVLIRTNAGDLSESVIAARVAQLAARLQFRPERVFTRALHGFVLQATPSQALALASQPEVALVAPDVPLQVSAQTVPTGVQRIGTLQNATAKIDGVDDPMPVDVAVLDSGIASHPDLNVVGGYDCTGSGDTQDRLGHGTHVAGIIGARDNGFGVVGVAPGARLWAVKVFNDQGTGYTSWLICGLDWVTAHANTIKVVNFSGGGSGSNTPNCGAGVDPLHQAICRAVAAGVTVVVAAGNDGRDASNTIPAAYPEVITVGAIVDTDGKPGGLGPATTVGADDTRASFSNYGPAVTLYAPGVLILSTYLNGGYATLSGTSMATPHVTGAAALYLVTNPGASPSAVKSWLVNHGEPGPWGPQPLVNVAWSSSATHDLQVTNLTVPSTVTAGVTATVQVTVRNAGTITDTALVSVTANGNTIAPTQSTSLAPGASQTMSFSWKPTSAGTVTLTAQAALSSGTDANPADNTRSVTVTVQSGSSQVSPTPSPTPSQPAHDVAVTAVNAPSTLRQGETASVRVTVVNRGTAAETVTVQLSSNPPNPSAGTMTTTISLSPGQSSGITFAWRTTRATSPGTYQLTATASIANDAVPSNNTASTTLTVTGRTTTTGRWR